MALPDIALPSETASIAGGEFAIRALSRTEVLRMRTFRDDPTGAEVYVLAAATGESEEAVTAWHGRTPSDVVNRLVTRVFVLSGIIPDEEEVADGTEDPSSGLTSGSPSEGPSLED